MIVTVATLALAFPYAYLMVRTPSSALRKILLIALFLPFFIGQVVRAYGWLIILGNEGLVNQLFGLVGLGPFRLIYNYPAVLFGLVQYMLPFAVLMLAPALTAIPEEIERAAESLGANWLPHVPPCRPADGAAGPDRRRHRRLHPHPHRLRHAVDPRRRHQRLHRQRHLRPVLPHLGRGLGATLTMLLVVLGSAVVGIVFAAPRHRHARPDAEGVAMSGRKPSVLWLIVGFSLITLSLPTLVIVGASFTAGKIIAFPPDGLSLKWYAAIADASDLRVGLPPLALCRDGLHAGRDPARHARRRRARQIPAPLSRRRCRSTCSCPSPSR